MLSLFKKKKSRKAKVLAAEFEPEERLSVRRSEGVGWAKMPRFLMPFLALLRHKQLVGSVDCDRVYLDLVSRDFGDGIVEAGDPEEHAFNAGFFGGRAARSWRERMAMLVELGAVIAKKKHTRDYGYLLLRDPDFVVRQIELGEHAKKDEIPDLIESYWRTRSEVGGADDDAGDLAAGRMAASLLSLSGQEVSGPTRGVDGRLLLIEHASELAAAVSNASDDELFRSAAGVRVAFADEFMKNIGVTRWDLIKKANDVGLKAKVIPTVAKEAK